MNRPIVLLFALTSLLFSFCKNKPGNAGEEANKSYKLSFQPAPGAVYHYEIINESETKLEMNGKKTDNGNRLETGLSYEIGQDSAGNYRLKMVFDKFRVTLKNKDGERQLDAAKAEESSDPVEKMLGRMKGAVLLATLNKKGEVLALNGCREMIAKIVSGIHMDPNTLKNMQEMLSTTMGEGFFKKNLEQSFRIFPDSAVRPGDSWNKTASALSDLRMEANTRYTLESVTDQSAAIEEKATLISNHASNKIFGYDVISDLKGEQKGSFLTDVTTGMLKSGTTSADIEGTIRFMGQDLPVTIRTTTTIVGDSHQPG